MFNALEHCISSDLHPAFACSRPGSDDNAGPVSDAHCDNTRTYSYSSAGDFTGTVSDADDDNDRARDDDYHDHDNDYYQFCDFGREQPGNSHRLEYSGILIQCELQHGKNGCLYRCAICDRGGDVLPWSPAPDRNSSERRVLLASPYG